MTVPAHKVFNDPVVEYRLLSTLTQKNNADYISKLTPILFTEDRIPVFNAIQSAYTKYGEVTHEGIKQFLNTNVPGELIAAPISNIDALIDESIRLAKKRLLNEKSQTIKELGYDFNPSDDAIAKAFQLDPIMAPQDSHLITGAQELMEDLSRKLDGDYDFVSTGLKFLDNSMGGEWRPKSLVVVMGDSGSGKTALVGDSMLRMATAHNAHASLFISLEMTKSDLIVRWLANMLNIDTRKIQTGKLTSEEVVDITEATKQLQRQPMFVLDDSTLTASQMIYQIRRHVKQHNIRTVFIDYLQIVNHHPTGLKNYDLGDFALLMKRLAKELNICIVLLSQLNRGGEGMNKLRDSGEVQHVADVMFELEPIDESNGSDPNRNMVAHFYKNRLGPLLIVPLLFVGKYQRFEDGEY